MMGKNQEGGELYHHNPTMTKAETTSYGQVKKKQNKTGYVSLDQLFGIG